MADLRIVDAPLIPKVDITGLEKIPTGGSGNYSISLGGVAEYAKESLDLANKTDVQTSENGVKALIKQHTDNLSNPHVVTKDQIGLGNVDNTADADKPMSNLTQSAITTLEQNKADKTSVYLKTETYNKNEVDSALANKPNSNTVYTKTETNNLLNGKVSSVNGKTGINVVLTREDVGVPSDITIQQWEKEARFIRDESGLTQQQINRSRKYVSLVSDLKTTKAVNGDVVSTNGHTFIGLGGGTYRFEQLSAKVDNNGAWIASTVFAGTWVLISENFIEQFGVIPNGSDQSDRIQASLDFYLTNNIKSFGFEKSNKYSTSSPIRLKQIKVSSSESYADPKLGTIFSFNGAIIEALSDNQKVIVVSRDNVQINDLVATTTKSGVVGVYNGLDVENNDLTLRRSSMRMVLNNPKFERLDIGMKFEPAETKNGSHWGSFYHCIYNPHAVSTNIMFDFRQSVGDGGNSNTRNTIIGAKHVGGSCTIYGEALESSVFLGVESEFISRPDARLPDGEAVVLYLPFGTPSNYQANRGNRFTGFNIEVCTNYINVNAPNTHIDGFQQGATNPLIKAWKYNNNYENISQVTGGSRMVSYNTTPRFGMVQINDNGVSNGFYLENLGIDKPYKLTADNGISFGAMSLPSVVKSETNRLNIQKSDDSYSFYIDYTSAFFPALGSTTGELGLTTSLIPTSGTLTIGSTGNRFSKLFFNNANISGLSIYADNATARSAGLIVGEFYRTATGQVMVAF